MPLYPLDEVGSLFEAPLYELKALEQYRQIFESAIARDIEGGDTPPELFIPMAPQLSEAGSIPHRIIASMFPNVFRKAFLISLYALLEASLVEIARYLHTRFAIPEKLETDRQLLATVERYYKTHFDILLFDSDSTREQVRLLSDIRNAVVHGNGVRFSTREKVWKQLEHASRSGVQLSTELNVLTISASMVEGYTRLVTDTLEGLVSNTRAYIRQRSTPA